MNDEIKEILDLLKYCVDKNEYLEEPNMKNWKPLLDYITNLQQENERLKAQLTDTEWEYQNTRCKYEKQYKKGITEELLEDIETCFFNRENPSMIPIDSLDICHIFGYIDYLKDYKSRCEKASEYITSYQKIRTVKVGDRNIIHSCLELIGDEYVKLLNILQNGSEENE